MRIRYVVSSMVFWGSQSRLSLERECRLLKSLGFGIELWPNTGGLNECRYDRPNWPRLAAATEGMLVSLRSRNDNPSIEQWLEQIQCAKLLNANIVADLRSLAVERTGEDNSLDFAAEVVKIAGENDVQLCVETGRLDRLDRLGEKFNSIRYCLDTGFANIDPNFSFRDYVDRLADKIAHLHLSDNFGSSDDHEPLGCACGIQRRDWDYLLSRLSKNDNDVIASLEMSPCPPLVMIHKASEYLFDRLGWPERPKAQSIQEQHIDEPNNAI